ncbi:2-phospho-L-lactate transferase [Ilumatobacter coccineus]|uniref:LPPG--FO 2-phopspho-L-lactate transferase n=1 Tax=Ilumatobacter coccineus (strain NBRC 103263 / KCTC 29153 / YM16-304) TaxID=1313172 RepID=A0A6C7EDH9_ILUCY|nr:2-phospho-L-lactate transferase [Ilumatobacter coccineus]BAN03175.1 LPPG--FO 2-phopspho-L-lactate transferase [Ilumatobacter coccineus YM16-304]
MSTSTDRIAVISGGVGAARFLRAVISAVDPERIDAVVNTGDDTVLHGLSISPDLDTVTYTLANAIDPVRGWGLVDETWTAMAALERYEEVRPDGSSAAPRWFGLGDQDLATHFYRTARLAEGATLTEVTEEIRRAWTVPIRLIPMSDERCSTMVTLADDGTEVSFQDYFVRLHHSVPVSSVRFDGEADLGPSAHDAIASASVVMIAPSNPLVSIGPIRSLPGAEDLLASRRDDCVAISPIVGGAALKGPADRMLTELGHEPTVVGVARLYAPIASVLVIDPADAALADAVEAEGLRCVVQPSIMSEPQVAYDLAMAALHSVGAG